MDKRGAVHQQGEVKGWTALRLATLRDDFDKPKKNGARSGPASFLLPAGGALEADVDVRRVVGVLRRIGVDARVLEERRLVHVIEQARFTPPYESMQRALKLQGKAKATKEAYCRAVRRSAEYFDRCPDDLSAEELRAYFANLLETHSWSTIKLR
ncbi:MAG: phage integrase N-terminal SAM-like domain-containing protein [Gammaproteobacteria bacterium]|nr:phage integrase N-terminal SAM-like domain-containing protein [Gammaproteobacteria bacterium]